MPEEKIILPAFVIADLYKNHLADVRDFSTEYLPAIDEGLAMQDKPGGDVHFLGQNKKRVTVLVNGEKAEVITDNNLQFLLRILKACKLELSDIAIVNNSRENVSIQQLNTELSPSFVLMFGVEPAQVRLPFTIPHFQVQEFAGCTYVTCPSLDEMMEDTPATKVLKTKLWAMLQKAFNL